MSFFKDILPISFWNFYLCCVFVAACAFLKRGKWGYFLFQHEASKLGLLWSGLLAWVASVSCGELGASCCTPDIHSTATRQEQPKYATSRWGRDWSNTRGLHCLTASNPWETPKLSTAILKKTMHPHPRGDDFTSLQWLEEQLRVPLTGKEAWLPWGNTWRGSLRSLGRVGTPKLV